MKNNKINRENKQNKTKILFLKTMNKVDKH